jgi:hypothetical protein
MNLIRHALLRLPTRLAVLGALLAALTVAG